MRGPAENFYAALKAAGMPEAPGVFSVVPQHQVISSAILAGISDFIRCFDRVTARKDLAGSGLVQGARDCAAETARRFVFSAPGIFICPLEAAGN